MREPMDEVTNPDTEVVVVKKSSQVGGTELLLNVMGFYIHQDPSPMLLIEPTIEIAEAYSKDRLAPMIRDTPVLTEKIPQSKSRSGESTILHKKFPGGHATLGGSNSPAGLASRPIRILLLDEVDRYTASAGAEGDATILAGKRTTTFWNRKKIYVSSPGLHELSKIEPAFLAGDQRYFHVPCHACEQFQKLEWSQVIWDHRRPETAHYACIHCGARWNDAQRWEAIHAGKWIAEAEFKGIASFHIWEAYSPWVRLSEMATAYLFAYEQMKQGNPEPMKSFRNTSLGETWTEAGDRPDSDSLLSRRENYGPDAVPWRVLYLTAGVDVQDDRIEVEVIGWRAEKRFQPEESWGIEVIVLTGDPAQPQVWDELDAVTKRLYPTEDGRQLRISAVGVDSGGHHTEMVYKFCSARFARNIYAVKGRAGALPIWPPRAGRSRRYRGSRVWTVGVDTAKETIYSRVRIKEENSPGFCHFPQAYDSEFFKQLTSEQVQTKFIRGFPVREWHKPPGVRNEALDRRAYALAALYSRNVPWEILVRAAPTEPPPPPSSGPGPAPSAPVAAPATPIARPVRFRTR